MEKISYKRTDKYVIRVIDNGNEIKEERMPIYNEDGTYNKEILNFVRENKTNSQSMTLKSASNMQTETKENTDLSEEKTSEKNEVVNIRDGEPGWLAKSRYYLAGGITVAAIVLACQSCGNQNVILPVTQEDQDNKEEEKTFEELKKDSRYTEITEKELTKATNDLINEFAKHNITINGEDALAFVAVANITHLENTNPELLSTVLGENPDSEAMLTKVGHVIGQVATLEILKNESVDWTKALIDETDKKIAQHGLAYVVKESKLIALDKDLNNREKSEKIQEIIKTNYINPNYDKTVGYEFKDGSHINLSQEDGADFITDAIITGILMGDNNVKNYIYKTEVHDDLKAISYNEDNVSNIMRMIEECENVKSTSGLVYKK